MAGRKTSCPGSPPGFHSASSKGSGLGCGCRDARAISRRKSLHRRASPQIGPSGLGNRRAAVYLGAEDRCPRSTLKYMVFGDGYRRRSTSSSSRGLSMGISPDRARVIPGSLSRKRLHPALVPRPRAPGSQSCWAGVVCRSCNPPRGRDGLGMSLPLLDSRKRRGLRGRTPASSSL